MAAKKPDLSKGFFTKAQRELKKQQNAQQRAQVIKENKQLAASDEEFGSTQKLVPTGVKYSEGYDSSKEALTAFPGAIHHDPQFHDRARAHIDEVLSRMWNVANFDRQEDPAGAKKLGVTNGLQRAVNKATPIVMAHADAAKNELARSFAAHQDGEVGGALAFNTAHVAFKNVHKHIADMHRTLLVHGAIDALDDKFGIGHNRLLSPEEQEGDVKGYTASVEASAVNKGVKLPKTALSPSINVSPFSEDYSDEGQRELRRRGLPATAEERVQQEANSRKLAREIAINNFKTAAERGQYTPTRAEMLRNEDERMYEEGRPQDIGKKPKPSAYAGVGITGFKELAQVAKRHFEVNNPGQSWEKSPHSKGIDVVQEANKHFAAANDVTDKKFTPAQTGKARAYLTKNAPHLLSAENHPTIKYANQHNLGVEANPETTLKMTMHRLGLTDMAGFAEKILKDKITTGDEDPTNPKNKEAKLKSLDEAPAPSVAPAPEPTNPVRARNVIFQGATMEGKR